MAVMPDGVSEAIQARLGDVGVVLYPGTPEDPPKFIKDEDLFYLQLRVFENPNPSGPIFTYERSEQGKLWSLVKDAT